MQKSIVGGSSETETTALAVMPALPAGPSVVTICTAARTRLIASRKAARVSSETVQAFSPRVAAIAPSAAMHALMGPPGHYRPMAAEPNHPRPSRVKEGHSGPRGELREGMALASLRASIWGDLLRRGSNPAPCMDVFLQQLINGIALGSIYGLIAIG